jgi:hypothetical protein
MSALMKEFQSEIHQDIAALVEQGVDPLPAMFFWEDPEGRILGLGAPIAPGAQMRQLVADAVHYLVGLAGGVRLTAYLDTWVTSINIKTGERLRTEAVIRVECAPGEKAVISTFPIARDGAAAALSPEPMGLPSEFDGGGWLATLMEPREVSIAAKSLAVEFAVASMKRFR